MSKDTGSQPWLKFGRFLVESRQKINSDIKTAASKLGVHPDQLRLWEGGLILPPEDLLICIASAYEIRPDELQTAWDSEERKE